MAFTIAPLSNTPLTRTKLPFGPFTVIPCTNGTSGKGLISNSSGSSDPTVYRSTVCISVDGIYIFVPSVAGVQAVESESLSPSADSTQAGTASVCSSISLIWAVKLSTALTTLPRFPGPDTLDRIVRLHIAGRCRFGDAIVAWARNE